MRCCQVAMCGRREAEGEAAAAAIRAAGGDASFFPCDVSQEADCVAVVASTVERYGRFDGAFNNAGVSGGDWEATSAEDYNYLMDINVRGVYFCLREEVAQMRRQGSPGSIVNCGSADPTSLSLRVAAANVAVGALWQARTRTVRRRASHCSIPSRSTPSLASPSKPPSSVTAPA